MSKVIERDATLDGRKALLLAMARDLKDQVDKGPDFNSIAIINHYERLRSELIVLDPKSSNYVSAIRVPTTFYLTDDLQSSVRTHLRQMVTYLTHTQPHADSSKQAENPGMYQLHPLVSEVSDALYESGHYNQAIFESYKLVENIVKDKTGSDKIGKALMAETFNPKAPRIELNELKSQIDLDEQEGFMHLFMGAMQGIRNPKAHGLTRETDRERTIEHLALASLLVKRIEAGQLVETPKNDQITGKTDKPKGVHPKDSLVQKVSSSETYSQIFQQVLGPAYTAVYNIEEQLTRMREEAVDTNFQSYPLTQVASTLLYNKLDPSLRRQITTFVKSVEELNGSKDVCKSLLATCVNNYGSKFFQVPDANSVMIWHHRGLKNIPVEGREIWLYVLVEKNPLEGALSQRVHSLTIGNTNTATQNRVELSEAPRLMSFWKEVAKQAGDIPEVLAFRVSLKQNLEMADKIKSDLSSAFDNSITGT